MDTPTVKVLAVDDHPANLDALEVMLGSTGYFVRRAMSGEEALKLLLTEEFACILLDVRMPGMNGHETAALIRADAQFKSLPIIFLTAEAREEEAMLQAYASGAVDYLIKPLRPAVVRSKVKVFGELYLQRAALESKQEVEALNRKLEVANRALIATNSDLEHFTYVTSHDLREPVRKVANLVDLLRRDIADDLNDRSRELMTSLLDVTKQLNHMIDDFRILTRLGNVSVEKQHVDIRALLGQLLTGFRERIKQRGVKVTFDVFPERSYVYPELIRMLFYNLITNAFQHTQGPGFDLHFTSNIEGETQNFGVYNTGSSIPESSLETLFRMFAQRSSSVQKERVGVGLSICKRIIDRHEGTICAESADDFVHVKFSLPSAI